MKKMTIAVATTLCLFGTSAFSSSFMQTSTASASTSSASVSVSATQANAAQPTLQPTLTSSQPKVKDSKEGSKERAEIVALIEKNFKTAFPQVTIEKITPFRYGLWEVFGVAGIVYTDSTGSILIQGNMIDLVTKKNLTEERLNILNKFEWSLIDKSKAIKVVNGNGKREMAVFSDPSCGFCKKFEADLPKLENVTIYTFLVDVLGSKSTESAKNIWCAGDNEKRVDAWKKHMIDGVETETKDCADVTKANMEVGRKSGVRGTPTIFFPDGSRLVGALPVEKFAEALNKQK